MFDNMSGETPLLLLVATLAFAAYLMGRRAGSGRRDRVGQGGPAPATVFEALPKDKQAEVDRLIAARKLIEAIKLVRDIADLELYDAKQVVDWRRAQMPPTPGI